MLKENKLQQLFSITFWQQIEDHLEEKDETRYFKIELEKFH